MNTDILYHKTEKENNPKIMLLKEKNSELNSRLLSESIRADRAMEFTFKLNRKFKEMENSYKKLKNEFDEKCLECEKMEKALNNSLLSNPNKGEGCKDYKINRFMFWRWRQSKT